MYIPGIFILLLITWALSGGDNYVDSSDCGDYIGDPPDCNFH